MQRKSWSRGEKAIPDAREESSNGAVWRRLTPGLALRAVGFLCVAFVMPLLFLTCRGAPPVSDRPVFPTWRLGEWWEVESTFAAKRPSQGASLAGLDLRHIFRVVGEEALDGVDCWRVEARPTEIRARYLRRRDAEVVVARLWVAKDTFRVVRIERLVGEGRQFIEGPRRKLVTEVDGARPVLLRDSLPSILDLPIGPLRSGDKVGVAWRAAVFAGGGGRREIRQTIDEIVEKRPHGRERVLRVTLSDGSLACNQVWRPDRPWPDSDRTWAGVAPEPPFVYRSRLLAWSRQGHLGVVFLIVGFLAQSMFTLRFLIQWIASERAGRSVIPMAFWYLSLGGGLMLLAYAIYRLDPVFILGQSFGAVIYVRNVWFRVKERRRPAADAQGSEGSS